MPEQFIYETSNNRTQRFIALCLMILLALSGLFFILGGVDLASGGKVSGNEKTDLIPDFVKEVTLEKQFLVSAMSGMIIFPIPNEVPFYMGLKQGNDPLLSILLTVLGFSIGNCITYFLGLKLSKQVVYLLSTKKIYELRRKVNTWGIYAIIAVNIIPSPSDILTFGLGMVRYNFKRLFITLVISNMIKFSILAFIILKIS